MTIELCEDVALVDPPVLPCVVEGPGGVEVVVGPPELATSYESELPISVLTDPPILPEVGLSHGGPTGAKGDPGIPGTGVQEIYVQATVPAIGAFPWLLAQLDAPGGAVEFLKVYEP